MNAKLKTCDSRHESGEELPNDGVASQVLRVSSQSPEVPALPGLSAAEATGWEEESRVVILRIGGGSVEAVLHPSVEAVVILRAIERKELVIVQQQQEQMLVIGVLRTSATPGLDVGDEYSIEARRLKFNAEHELVLNSGAVRIVLAAVGQVETIAKNITSRASSLHKIIGRAIRLN